MTAGTYGRYGISTVVKNLAIQLVKSGNDVTIGAFRFSEQTPDCVHCEKLLFHLDWVSLDRKYDVVHSHQPSTNFLAALSKVPFVYEYYGSPHNLLNLNRISMEISLRLVQRLKKKIVAISQAAADDLVLRLKDIDVEVVPLGVDNKRFNYVREERYRKGTPQLLFVGHLRLHKRVDELISAMKGIISIYPYAYLQIIGSGAELGSLRNHVARLGLTKNVGFLGWVPEDELPFYYSSCDVYVTASGWEMFGLPLLEAMACGKPVVASSIPAHRELICKSKAGVLYKMGDTKDLTKKLCKAYEEGENYARHGLLFSKKNDWSVVADQVLRIYAQILNKRVLRPKEEH